MPTNVFTFRWTVPPAAHLEEAKKFLPEVFGRFALCRIWLAFTVVFLAAAYLLPEKIPNMDVDWPLLYLKCLGSGIALIAGCCIIVCIPPILMVSTKGIWVIQYPNNRMYLYAQLEFIQIDPDAKPYPLLTFLPRGRQTPIQYAIAPSVNPRELHSFIADYKYRT